MKVDIQRIVDEALRHVGQREATGRNDGPFVERVLGGESERGLAWCAAFALRCYEWAGYKLPVNFWKCRRVATLYDVLEDAGAVLAHGEPPEPGDFAIWLGSAAHRAAGTSGHVGVVVSVANERSGSGRRVDVVEGNSGNAVQRRTYHALVGPPITAFARPRRLLES